MTAAATGTNYRNTEIVHTITDVDTLIIIDLPFVLRANIRMIYFLGILKVYYENTFSCHLQLSS